MPAPRSLATIVFALCAAAGLAGCAGARAGGPAAANTVTLLVSGDERASETVAAELVRATDLPVDVRRVELPRGGEAPAGFDDVQAALARARRAYIDADFAACLALVRDDATVTGLLSAGRRDLASRVLFWRVACQVGAGADADAARSSRRLATLGLDVPPDVEAAAPEVEAAIAGAQHEVAASPRTEVRLSAAAPAASFSVDGRAAACGSPCAVDLPPGDHVIGLDAEGETPTTVVLRAEGTRVERAVESSPADPALAGQQWVARYAGSDRVDASGSLRLLARAVRARDVLLVTADDAGNGAERLRGAYAVDGAVRARGERVAPRGAVGREARGLFRELLVRGGTVVERPVYASPVFWGVVAGASVAAAVVVGVLVAPTTVRTEVGF